MNKVDTLEIKAVVIRATMDSDQQPWTVNAVLVNGNERVLDWYPSLDQAKNAAADFREMIRSATAQRAAR